MSATYRDLCLDWLAARLAGEQEGLHAVALRTLAALRAEAGTQDQDPAPAPATEPAPEPHPPIRSGVGVGQSVLAAVTHHWLVKPEPEPEPQPATTNGNGRETLYKRLAAVCKAAGLRPDDRDLIHYAAAQVLRLPVPEVKSLSDLTVEQVQGLIIGIEHSEPGEIADMIARHSCYRASQMPSAAPGALMDVPAQAPARTPGVAH